MIKNEFWQSFIKTPEGPIQVNLPSGFSPATTFPGWQKEEVLASVQVASYPVDPEEIVHGFTPESLEEKGLYWLGQETVSSAGESWMRVIHALQASEGELFWLKWIAVLGEPGRAFVVTGSLPRESDSADVEAVKAIVYSAMMPQDDAIADSAEPGALVTVQPTAELAIARQSASFLLLTPGGKLPVSPEAPQFLVGWSAAQSMSTDQLPDVSRERVKNSAIEGEIEIISEAEQTVLGVGGYGISAKSAETQLCLWQGTCLQMDTLFVFQGICREADLQQWEPRFLEMASQAEFAGKLREEFS